MTPEEQIKWCARNKAAVWFTNTGTVKVKVRDIDSALKGETLDEAIANVEKLRELKRNMHASLYREK